MECLCHGLSEIMCILIFSSSQHIIKFLSSVSFHSKPMPCSKNSFAHLLYSYLHFLHLVFSTLWQNVYKSRIIMFIIYIYMDIRSQPVWNRHCHITHNSIYEHWLPQKAKTFSSQKYISLLCFMIAFIFFSHYIYKYTYYTYSVGLHISPLQN